MCWTVFQADKPVKQIAKKDITCYKLMLKDKSDPKLLRSSIRRYRYMIGMVAYSKIDEPIYRLEERKFSPWNIKDAWVIEKGLHSYATKLSAIFLRNKFLGELIVRCTIPKGSEYYKSSYEYVSNTIIIEEVIK